MAGLELVRGLEGLPRNLAVVFINNIFKLVAPVDAPLDGTACDPCSLDDGGAAEDLGIAGQVLLAFGKIGTRAVPLPSHQLVDIQQQPAAQIGDAEGFRGRIEMTQVVPEFLLERLVQRQADAVLQHGGIGDGLRRDMELLVLLQMPLVLPLFDDAFLAGLLDLLGRNPRKAGRFNHGQAIVVCSHSHNLSLLMDNIWRCILNVNAPARYCPLPRFPVRLTVMVLMS